MNKKIVLLTSSHCPKCPAAKEYLDKHSIEYTVAEVDTAVDARVLANLYNVMTVPTVVEFNDDGTGTSYSFEEYKNR